MSGVDHSGAFERILDAFSRYFRLKDSDYETAFLTFPTLPCPTFGLLCRTVREIFRHEPMLLSLQRTTTIIGDLHGHIIDLFRVLGTFGLPPRRTYLFLGDLVDRGEFSTETLILVFVLKVLFPMSVYIIRGNHEFSDMISHGGFSDELRFIYGGDAAERLVLDAFSWMPIAACIGQSVLCVHGGIGPGLESLAQISGVKRPLRNYEDDDIVESLVWSDPLEVVREFQPSSRGLGYEFGADALAKFLDGIGFSYMVRGHEVADGGVEAKPGARIITVFGASNYCGESGNRAGVLTVHPDGSREVCVFPPMPYIRREAVEFLSWALVKQETENIPLFRVNSLVPRLPRLETHARKPSPETPVVVETVKVSLPKRLSLRRRVFSPVPRV
jgi:protein phosphatase